MKVDGSEVFSKTAFLPKLHQSRSPTEPKFPASMQPCFTKINHVVENICKNIENVHWHIGMLVSSYGWFGEYVWDSKNGGVQFTQFCQIFYLQQTHRSSFARAKQGGEAPQSKRQWSSPGLASFSKLSSTITWCSCQIRVCLGFFVKKNEM